MQKDAEKEELFQLRDVIDALQQEHQPVIERQ